MRIAALCDIQGYAGIFIECFLLDVAHTVRHIYVCELGAALKCTRPNLRNAVRKNYICQCGAVAERIAPDLRQGTPFYKGNLCHFA